MITTTITDSQQSFLSVAEQSSYKSDSIDIPSASKYRFAVIIVNYRTPDLVGDCIESFVPWLDLNQDRIVVVDNQSADQSLEKIASRLATNGLGRHVDLIAAEENGGFSYGNNLGIQSLDADYYWLTNSDTLCRPNAPEILANSIHGDQSIGLIAPQLEWPDGATQVSCFRYISPLSELINAAATGPITSLLKRFDVPLHNMQADKQPDWVSFASVIVRREVFNQVGMMDEDYFMYFEDVDFSRRAKQAGWKIAYCPKAEVVHLRGGSSPVKSLTKERKRRPNYYYASRSRYLSKFYGKGGFWLANALWWVGRSMAYLREMFEKKTPHTCKHEGIDIWTNGLNPMRGDKQ